MIHRMLAGHDRGIREKAKDQSMSVQIFGRNEESQAFNKAASRGYFEVLEKAR